MRDVNFQNWSVSPHHTYFLHVQNAPDGEAVGLSLVQIGDGSEPCIGLDSHGNDNYSGHVYVVAGKPVAGVEVQYLRDKQFIAETLTDVLGRHSVRLPPGLYQYRFLALGESREWEILVKPGLRVVWQDVDADGAPGDAKERQIKFITEELIFNWDNSDGAGFSWQDVVEVVSKIGDSISKSGAMLRQCSFAKFCRPDLIGTLQGRGVWAVETGWNDQHFAAAFRNLLAVSRARLVRLKTHDEARSHLERNTQFVTPTRVGAPEGTYNYLALARAAAVYHASTLAGSVGDGVAIFDPARDGTCGAAPGTSGLPGAFGGGRARIEEQIVNPRV